MYSFLPSSDLRDFPEDQEPPSPRRLARQSRCPSSLLSRPRHPHPLHPRGRKGSDRSNEKTGNLRGALPTAREVWSESEPTSLWQTRLSDPCACVPKSTSCTAQNLFFTHNRPALPQRFISWPGWATSSCSVTHGFFLRKGFQLWASVWSSTSGVIVPTYTVNLFQNSGSQRLSTDILIEEWRSVHESAFHLNLSQPKVLHGFLTSFCGFLQFLPILFYSARLSEALQGCPRFSKVRQRTHSSLKFAKVRWGSRVLQEKILQGSKMFHEVRLGFQTFWEGRWGSTRFFWRSWRCHKVLLRFCNVSLDWTMLPKKFQYGCVRFLKVPQCFCKVLQGSVGFCQVLQGSLRFYQVLWGSPRFK